MLVLTNFSVPLMAMNRQENVNQNQVNTANPKKKRSDLVKSISTLAIGAGIMYKTYQSWSKNEPIQYKQLLVASGLLAMGFHNLRQWYNTQQQ